MSDSVKDSPNVVETNVSLIRFPYKSNHSAYAYEVTERWPFDSYIRDSLDNIVKCFDWSSETDSVYGSNAIEVGNVDTVSDGETTFNNCFKSYSAAVTGAHTIVYSTGLPGGSLCRAVGWLYIPDTNTNTNGVQFGVNPVTSNFTKTGEWIYFDVVVATSVSGTFYIYHTKDGNTNLPGAGNPEDDIVYLYGLCISYSDTLPVRFFRNPNTNLYEQCYLVHQDEIGANNEYDIVCNKIYVPKLADVVFGDSATVTIHNPSGLKHTTEDLSDYFAVAHDADRFRVYDTRIGISSIPDLADLQDAESGSTSNSGSESYDGDITETIGYEEAYPTSWPSGSYVSFNGHSDSISDGSVSSTTIGNLNSTNPVVTCGDGFLSVSNLNAQESISITVPSGYFVQSTGELSWQCMKGRSASTNSSNDGRTKSKSNTVTYNKTYTKSREPSIRAIVCASDPGKVAGDEVAVFNNDKLAYTVTAESVVGNTIYVKISDMPGKEIKATHIGGTYKEYSLLSKNVHTKTTVVFYIIGLTTGINDFFDIPAIQGDDSPQEQLAAISDGDEWLQVSDSDLSPFYDCLYTRTIVEAKVSDVFKEL